MAEDKRKVRLMFEDEAGFGRINKHKILMVQTSNELYRKA